MNMSIEDESTLESLAKLSQRMRSPLIKYLEIFAKLMLIALQMCVKMEFARRT